MSNVTLNANATAVDAYIDSCSTDVPAAELRDVHVALDANGDLQHNLDLSGYSPEARDAIEASLVEAAHELEALERQMKAIEDADDVDELIALHVDYSDRIAQVADFKARVDAGQLHFDGVAPDRNGAVAEPADDPEALGLDDTSSTSADGPDGEWEMPWSDAAEAVAAFEQDPTGFFEELAGAGSEERAAIIMMVQTEIQKNNQLMSTLTNFQKAQHDTQKAVISNIRV